MRSREGDSDVKYKMKRVIRRWICSACARVSAHVYGCLPCEEQTRPRAYMHIIASSVITGSFCLLASAGGAGAQRHGPRARAAPLRRVPTVPRI